ncbi:MAG: hypothetical protein CR986_07790 [Ignavibacteriae bacterium]|nr:MAG: hypothetical protein CR986_07790 [Ignavibacteriota bacterium]
MNFECYNEIPNSILAIDKNFTIRVWNKHLESCSKIKAADIVGKNILKKFNHLNNSVFISRVKGVLLGGSPSIFSAEIHNYLIPCKNPDGEYQTHHTIVKAIQLPEEDDEHNYLAFFFIKDITKEANLIIKYREKNKIFLNEIKEKAIIQEKLLKSEKRLKENNAQKNKFFSILAHDLKAPFSSILEMKDMITDKSYGFTEEEMNAILCSIFDSMQNTYYLLEDLLTWSRTQVGRLKCKPKELALNDLIDNVYASLKNTAKNKNIKIEFDTNEIKIIKADIFMFSTVLRNLISNAIKFSYKDGTVKVNFKNKLNENNVNDLQISVIDNGIGIKEEDQEKLFRIDISHSTIGTDKEKGTGLGLILCKEFVEQHKGKIWFKSKLNEGATFNIILPQ